MVEYLVAALNNDDKELIEALYFKGMTYDRACEVLDISRATVTARRKRAINRMVEMIK